MKEAERSRQIMKKLEEYVRSIPDFPEPGIIFRDVTSVLQDADGLHLAIDTMQNMIKDLDIEKLEWYLKENVCDILEGGTEAFRKREQKYNINNKK